MGNDLLDTEEVPFLYSAGTKLAYDIAKDYYNNTHYVWCAVKFNSPNQAPTSNPATICNRYLSQIISGDRHMDEIPRNITGILNGAKHKFSSGIISDDQRKGISGIVNCAKYRDFMPILYIIDSKKVINKLKIVPEEERACPEIVEYRIFDLEPGEFEIIDFSLCLANVIKIIERKVDKQKIGRKKYGKY